MAHTSARTETSHGGGASNAPATARAGRPRNPEADQAILEVAIRILRGEGYRSLNIERVAEESGIAKTTIYRRYQDRQDLAAAAIGALLEAHGAFATPDTGGCRADLKIIFAALRSADSSSPLLAVLGAVLSEGQRDAALLERLWERAFGPHHRALATVLQRGIERAELRSDLDIGATIEILVGTVLARLIPGGPVTDDWVESVIATVWLGIESRRP
ncbi:MAG TPA: TetR/AcrR family transcriptional regulator [Dehalococcoidia bacterium]|nr:TetR/AcrR family transcriptional regulator [Dehalococcoidia bacterium]